MSDGLDGKALWHGRFEGGPSAELMAFTESLSFDRRLWPDDIAGSVAHVLGLAHVDIITEAEASSIIAALDQVSMEMDSGHLRVRRERRRHPHRHRTTSHRDCRIRPVPSCTPVEVATTRRLPASVVG